MCVLLIYLCGFTFFQLLYHVNCEEKQWPTKFSRNVTWRDYCQPRLLAKAKRNCHGVPPSLCLGCQYDPETEFWPDDVNGFVHFRQVMTDKHNEFRNKAASMEDKNPKWGKYLPNAADMEVLNYDMELEFIIRCYTQGKRFPGPTSGHDACGMTLAAQRHGQNLGGWPYKNKPKNFTPEAASEIVYHWYKELVHLTATLLPYDRKLQTSKDGSVGHFVTMTWGSLSLLGCTKFWRAKLVNYKASIHCNYLVTDPDPDRMGPSIIGKNSYKPGPPCSQCAQNKSCNDKYIALCGELLPMPTEPPVSVQGVEQLWKNKWIFFAFTLLFLLIMR